MSEKLVTRSLSVERVGKTIDHEGVMHIAVVVADYSQNGSHYCLCTVEDNFWLRQASDSFKQAYETLHDKKWPQASVWYEGDLRDDAPTCVSCLATRGMALEESEKGCP